MDQKVQVQVSTSTVPLSTHELKLVQANYQGKVRIILAGNTMMNWHPVKVVSSNDRLCVPYTHTCFSGLSKSFLHSTSSC